MFPPLTPQICITQALQHVDLNIFPSFGMGMLTNNSVLNEVRQEFIYGCILHGTLPADSVNQLLGETPFEPPPTPESRYHKDVLSQQCVNEPGKAVQLIGELEKLDGNAGAIVGAVTEVRTQDLLRHHGLANDAFRIFEARAQRRRRCLSNRCVTLSLESPSFWT